MIKVIKVALASVALSVALFANALANNMDIKESIDTALTEMGYGPELIKVDVQDDGHVFLSGDVESGAIARIETAVSNMEGVTQVTSTLKSL